MAIRFFAISIFVLLTSVLKAQDSSSVFLTGGAHFGHILTHTPVMSHLIRGHSYGGYIRMMKQVDGQKDWHINFGLPTQGAELYYAETGNNQQLGKQIALSYIIGLGLNKQIKELKHFHHFLNLGLGIGYATKSWDFENNRQAIAIGSRVNAALTLHYEVKTKIGLYAGIRLTHFSNGAFQLPNLGTNTLSASLRFQLPSHTRKMTEAEKRQYTVEKKQDDGPWMQSIAIGLGAKEVPPYMSRKYLAGSFTFVFEKRKTAKSSFGFGLDVFHNSSLKILLSKKENYDNTVWQSSQLGVLFSYGLHFGKVQLKIQQGVYAYSLWTDYGMFYQRVGLRYYWNKNWFASLHLKTHFAKADYGELGIGYTWRRK